MSWILSFIPTGYLTKLGALGMLLVGLGGIATDASNGTLGTATLPGHIGVISAALAALGLRRAIDPNT